MAIFKGSTPTINVVLSEDEVPYDTISKVYLTFAQNGTVNSTLNTTLNRNAGVRNPDHTATTYSRKFTQSETLALHEDEDLECQVDVITTDSDRKISKIFSFGVCKVLRNSSLT